MCSMDFQAILKALGQLQLSSEQLASLQALLAANVHPGECLALIEAAAGQRRCPHCACERCHRSGSANGLQRYRCTACDRSFNILTGTPLARLRLREKWLPYLHCLLESTTVRSAATRVAVANSTSFRWRHRFIAAGRHERRAESSGIEADCIDYNAHSA